MTASTAVTDRQATGGPFIRRIIKRIEKRRSPTHLPFKLEHRSIFVVPSAFGWAFGLMLAVMALGGLNFNNNMALLLVFILGVIAQMTTLMAYRNLKGQRVESVRCDPVFAGEQAHFEVFLCNPEARDRFAVMAGMAAGPGADCIDLEPQSTGSLSLPVDTRVRGWLPMPAFRLETRYPLGLFKAWTWIFPEARCLVYPQPVRHPPPLPQFGSGDTGRAEKGEGEQVHGLRKYRPGDPLRRVAWRTSARHDDLYSREMEIPQQESCALSWDALRGMDTETRLSTLTTWVLMADHRQISYSLELPERFLGSDNGPEHRARCLEALALHEL